MIAALGTSVAETNEEFVWRHGLTYLNIRSKAEVCHIPSGLNRRPEIGELAAALFAPEAVLKRLKFSLKLASQPYHQRPSRQRRKILQERSVHAHFFVKQILAL